MRRLRDLLLILTAALALANVLLESARAEDDEDKSPGISLRVKLRVDKVGIVLGRNAEWVGSDAPHPIDAFELALDEPIPDLGVEYRFHTGNLGDCPVWRTGFVDFNGRYIQGISIRLTGNASSLYDVLYQCRIEDVGETRTHKNGAFCGTRGLGKNSLGFVIVVRPKK
jgi:hypothetical protein